MRTISTSSNVFPGDCGRMIGVASDVPLGDESAEGVAEHDRFLDAERVAETYDIVGPGVGIPFIGGPPVAATLPAMVVHDDLGDVAHLVQTEYVRRDKSGQI